MTVVTVLIVSYKGLYAITLFYFSKKTSSNMTDIDDTMMICHFITLENTCKM
jgi:hypothetical protein